MVLVQKLAKKVAQLQVQVHIVAKLKIIQK